MRHLLLTAIAVTAALIAGCTKTTGNTDNAATDNTDGQIDSTSVRATLMESTRAYKFGLDGDSCYLTMSARVEWPREIGDAHLAKLSDTLIGAAFPSGKGLTVQDAMIRYLNDTRGIIDGPSRRVQPLEVPDTTPDAWTITTDVMRTAITDKYVTYMATTMSYLGGAHPNTVVTPISYDLTTGEVITPSYLFIPGSDTKIIAAVASQLASQLGCRPDRLTDGGLFSDTLPMPSGISVNPYGMIVFQYGQYEIAPYSMGIITVEMSPYQLRNILTPAARALLLP